MGSILVRSASFFKIQEILRDLWHWKTHSPFRTFVKIDYQMNYIAIMAGGVGSRFWPASRSHRPKQFLDILGTGKSLLRMTFERFLHIVPASHIYIVTNAEYQSLVLEHLPELTPQQVLCEPSRNNTAPCVAYAAMKLRGLDPDANMVVAPSDHIILEEKNFLNFISQALDYTASHEALLTLGIRPSRPDTGYGYIHYEATESQGIHPVKQFMEKPPLEQAKAFVASGEYLWNAGIFIWRAETVLRAFEQFSPDIYRILDAGRSEYNTDREQTFIDQAYPTTPSISVDYAIMEKATNVYTIPSSFGWSDLGTWASLYAELPGDEHGNVTTSGQVVASNTRDTLIRAPKDKLVVVDGLDDYIVVDEGDVLLIFPKSKEQDIKAVNARISQQYGSQFS